MRRSPLACRSNHRPALAATEFTAASRLLRNVAGTASRKQLGYCFRRRRANRARHIAARRQRAWVLQTPPSMGTPPPHLRQCETTPRQTKQTHEAYRDATSASYAGAPRSEPKGSQGMHCPSACSTTAARSRSHSAQRLASRASPSAPVALLARHDCHRPPLVPRTIRPTSTPQKPRPHSLQRVRHALPHTRLFSLGGDTVMP